MGYGPEFVGQVNSVALVIFALASLPAGTLGMRYGARPIMIAGVSSRSRPLARSPSPMSCRVILSPSDHGDVLAHSTWCCFLLCKPSPLWSSSRQAADAASISIQSALNTCWPLSAGPLPVSSLCCLLPTWGGRAWTRRPTRAADDFNRPLPGGIVADYARAHTPSGRRGSHRNQTRAPPAVAVSFISILVILSLVRFLTAAGTGARHLFQCLHGR